MRADLHALQNFYQQMTAEVQAALQEAGSSLPISPPLPLMEGDVDEVLASAVRLEREQVYKDTLRKPRWQDYIFGTSHSAQGRTVGTAGISAVFLYLPGSSQWSTRIVNALSGLVGGLLVNCGVNLWSTPRERARAERQALDNAVQALRQVGQKLPPACQEVW